MGLFSVPTGGDINALKGGVSKTYTAFLVSTAPEPVATPAVAPQQQQQQQTVVLSGQKEQESIGSVSVTANVDAADVSVDGMFVGNTPTNLKLPPGIHVIEVSKNGYGNYKRELHVYANSDSPLKVELRKE